MSDKITAKWILDCIEAEMKTYPGINRHDKFGWTPREDAAFAQLATAWTAVKPMADEEYREDCIHASLPISGEPCVRCVHGGLPEIGELFFVPETIKE